MGHSSYTYCRHLTRAARSSFPLAFRLLPPAKRRAMDALYAFSRVTDDLADGPGELAAKRESLLRWRAALADALTGRYSHPVHPALHDAVRRFAVPPDYLYAIIDGVETDLEPVRFATFADLYPYCYRVASAVGLACVRVWGLRPGASFAEVDPPAEAAGVAFQLTNILRDLGEDAARGRVYLPSDELRRFGCEPGSAFCSRPPRGRARATQPTANGEAREQPLLPSPLAGESGPRAAASGPGEGSYPSAGVSGSTPHPAAGGRDPLPQGERVDNGPARPPHTCDPLTDPGYKELMRFQVARARDYYRRAEPLDRLLSADGRAIFRVMAGTYRVLLAEIERRGYDVFTARVRVPRWRKGLIFLAAWPVKWGLL